MGKLDFCRLARKARGSVEGEMGSDSFIYFLGFLEIM